MFQIVKRSKREREGDDAIEILCWNCSGGKVHVPSDRAGEYTFN